MSGYTPGLGGAAGLVRDGGQLVSQEGRGARDAGLEHAVDVGPVASGLSFGAHDVLPGRFSEADKPGAVGAVEAWLDAVRPDVVYPFFGGRGHLSTQLVGALPYNTGGGVQITDHGAAE